MLKSSINFLSSSAKVLYDKTTDYVNYYSGNKHESESSDSSDNDDTLKDYNGVLKIELYQNENQNTRIYPTSSYYNEYTTFWGNPTHVVDNIYLGSAYNAASYDLLKELNIGVIINATSEISNYYPDEFIYLNYKLYDNNKHSIKKYLERSFDDIIYHQQNTKGNILIHCFMGASRSASIVLYYLMRTQKSQDGKPYSFDDAVSYLRGKRIIVNPTFRLTKDLASSIFARNTSNNNFLDDCD
jgi:hypothetical protein